MNEEEIKRATKEAIKEWLNDQFSQFGKWAFRSVAAAVFAALVYFVLLMNGFHK